MMRRRRSSVVGFVMAEALVSLAVAAMTLALLTSATWGLRLTVERRAATAETGADDWLAARRALQGWASGASAESRDNVAAKFIGTASTARMVVEPVGSGQTRSFVAELRVVALSENSYALVAERHFGQQDARVVSENTSATEIVQSNEPIRLLYLMQDVDGGAGRVWRYETGAGAIALPFAVAVEVGTERMLTARIFNTVSAACLAAYGPGGLETSQCELR